MSSCKMPRGAQWWHWNLRVLQRFFLFGEPTYPADIATRIKIQTRFCQSAIKGHRGYGYLLVMGLRAPSINLLRGRGSPSDWASSQYLRTATPKWRQGQGIYLCLPTFSWQLDMFVFIRPCSVKNIVSLGNPASCRVARGTIIAAPPLWTPLLQRAIFILAGMNFLYTISWERIEESFFLSSRQSGLFGVMTLAWNAAVARLLIRAPPGGNKPKMCIKLGNMPSMISWPYYWS